MSNLLDNKRVTGLEKETKPSKMNTVNVRRIKNTF